MEETNINESDFKEFEVEEASHSIASVILLSVILENTSEKNQITFSCFVFQ
jgi:hypothetical protein